MNSSDSLRPPTQPRLGLTGRAVYRASMHTRDWSGLCRRVEAAVRSRYEGDDFVISTNEYFSSWFVHARRGLTSGFTVGSVNRPGPRGGADVTIWVSRSSCLQRLGVWVAAACVPVAFVAGCLLVVLLRLPALGAGLVVLAVTVGALVGVVQMLIGITSLVEYVVGGRFTAEQMESVVESVRGVVADPP